MSAGEASLRLTLWTCLAIGGLIDVMIASFRGDLVGFVVGLWLIVVCTFMLGTGLWMRWPRVRH